MSCNVKESYLQMKKLHFIEQDLSTDIIVNIITHKLYIILHEEKLKSKGITVWSAVAKDDVLSYDIYHQTMTADRYVSVSNNHIVPHLRQPDMRVVFSSRMLKNVEELLHITLMWPK